MKKLLSLSNISSSIEGKAVLKDISLDVGQNEVHVILGPNGAGKSTLGNVIMGNPLYKVTSGSVSLNGNDLLNDDVSTRAKKGIFISFQQPPEISGVTLVSFLRTSYNAIKEEELNMGKFHKLLKEKMKILEMDPSFRTRQVNLGFSGGEKKRFEVLQLSLLTPKIAILDEIDSGLDVDALKLLSKQIAQIKKETKMAIILITHHTKILEYLKPDAVHILQNGSLVKTGGVELIKEVEESGFSKE